MWTWEGNVLRVILKKIEMEYSYAHISSYTCINFSKNKLKKRNVAIMRKDRNPSLPVSARFVNHNWQVSTFLLASISFSQHLQALQTSASMS